MISEDFIHWEHMPIALYPDQSYEETGGCFSGTAMQKNGKMVLMYTGVSKEGQQQCMAYSEDGVNFCKETENPVIPAFCLPKGATADDFRDPKVYEKNGMNYCLVGTRMNGLGNILLFRGDDLRKWEYVGPLFQDSGLVNGIFECPDFAVVDGQQIVITSPMNVPRQGNHFQNLHSSVYLAGELNHQTGHFTHKQSGELDYGFDFYAPQTMCTEDGRVVLIAWKEMWGRSFPTAKDMWVGSYTFPRELHYADNQLLQKPVAELESCRSNPITAVDIYLRDGDEVCVEGVAGSVLELNLHFKIGSSKKVGLKVFCGPKHSTRIYYDACEGSLVFDRSQSGVKIRGIEKNTWIRKCDINIKDGNLRLQILLDISCVEIFAEDGCYVMTGNVYPDPQHDNGIKFFSEGGDAHIASITKYDICV